ncbi:interleukin-18 receptor 1 [Sorex fumeus]|uniref:interleukin-18 receptor 1 n=1 Tax=Sorex fumeus TaxID=62283 RepID=UPI0024AD3881|nr:interleukin-18 receptor 1 [Sorex fumeus]
MTVRVTHRHGLLEKEWKERGVAESRGVENTWRVDVSRRSPEIISMPGLHGERQLEEYIESKLGFCISRYKINVVEGEYFFLKCCLPKSQNKNGTVKWYKNSDSLGFVEITSSSSPRIVSHNYGLEFWPLELDDSGSYKFCMGNYTCKWKLNVCRRSNHRCYSEEVVHTQSVEVGEFLSIKCDEIFEYNKSLINSTSLYKDCEISKSGDSFIKNEAEFGDGGYYTCIYSLLYNGKLFNITKTINMKINNEQSISSSFLPGPEIEIIEVELGKDVQLNCSAFVDRIATFYWEYENYSNVHEKISKPTVKMNINYVSRILIIEKINEKNINTTYTCHLANSSIHEKRTFILKKKVMHDISDHVFTRGMIITVFISMAIVCLVILGIIYRVDLVLFYRSLMRRDETLADGKKYDAFVSYLKECQAENEEAHSFAVEILPRVLEKHFGYKLCIFERDVVPGKAIVDEIHSLIENSRRLIIVLSKSYMSNEVRYELESGIHEALVERKIKIILIKCSSVSDFTFLPRSLELLKSHRILKWKTDKPPSYNSRFWKNLLYLMPAKAIKPCKDEDFFPFFS